MESVQDEITLTGDEMRLLCSHLEDPEDHAALSRLSQAWRHALQQQNDDFWRGEWEAFVTEHGDKEWFTKEVLDYDERKESRLSGFLNASRGLVGKDAKEHLSFRQRWFENQVPMENPTYVDLLLTNRQRQLNAMTSEQRREFFSKLNQERPSCRQALKDLAAIPGAVVLAGLGLVLAPPGLLGQGVKMLITGKPPSRRGGGCGENAGVGIAQALEDYWPLAPAALSLFGSFSLLTMFARDVGETPRQIRQLYRTTAEYLKKDSADTK